MPFTKYDRILFDSSDDGGSGGSGDSGQHGDGDGGDPQLAGAALQSALRKERRLREEAEKERKSLEARLKKIEEDQLTETERLRNRLAELERERNEERERLERERTERMRADLVRRAAAKANFADSDDVVALLRGRDQLGDIEDDLDADRVVRQLAQDKPHLLRTPQAPDLNGPHIEQVLQGGIQPPADQGPTRGGKRIIPQAKLVEMSADQLRALKVSDPELLERSMEAMLGDGTLHHTVA